MRFDISKVTNALSRVSGRTGLVAKKYAPEIMLVAGVGCIVGGTVMACKATLQVEPIIDDAKKDLDDLRGSEDERDNKAIARTYISSGTKLARLYGPSVGLITGGIGLVCGSHHIMHSRNVALVAAYELAEKSFSEYRNRVAEKYGEDEERNIRYNLHDEKIDVIEIDPKTGKEKKKKETVSVTDTDIKDMSQYARYFDDSSREWTKSPEYNKSFLIGQQNYFNNLLQGRGHVFLNEVYDALGFKRSRAGQMVGWIYDPDSNDRDNYIDFGMQDLMYQPCRDFVNGYNNMILLDFNVDGVIYDLI